MDTTLIIVSGIVAIFFIIGAMDILGKTLNKHREYKCPNCGEIIALGPSDTELRRVAAGIPD